MSTPEPHDASMAEYGLLVEGLHSEGVSAALVPGGTRAQARVTRLSVVQLQR